MVANANQASSLVPACQACSSPAGVDLRVSLCVQHTPVHHLIYLHCSGALHAEHVLVAGPSGSGKSWLLWDATLAIGTR
eukprot:scaffold197285_cov22-Tisochrysis_lutea.AAC.1